MGLHGTRSRALLPAIFPPRGIVAALLLAVAMAALLLPTSTGAAGAPQQVHLSWQQGGSSSSISVTWATDSISSGSGVRLGLTSALELGYRSTDSFAMPNEGGLYLHHALLTGLAAGARYYYAVGANATGWSSTMSFVANPGTADNFTFVATADMGVNSNAASNLATMGATNPSFVLHAGDLSYANGNEATWDAWFRQIQPLASRAPYMPTIGNHEYEGGYGLSAYLGRFALPNNERWYSFNYSNVHVISLDGGSGYSSGVPSGETAWLEHDLQYNSQDAFHPWTVVVFHFPPFSSGTTHGSWSVGRSTWSFLFDKYGVELVINGHEHNYERTWPVYASATVAQRNYTNPKAPVYVVTGGGGAGLYSFSSTQPGWSAFRQSTHETLKVTVEGNRMTVRAIRPDGSQLDGFVMTKGPGTPTPPPSGIAKLSIETRYADQTVVSWAWVEVWDGIPWALGSHRILASSNIDSTYTLGLSANHPYYVKGWGDAGTGYLGQVNVTLTADRTVRFVDPTNPYLLSPRVQVYYYPWYGNLATDGQWIHWNEANHGPPDDIASVFYPTLGAYSTANLNTLRQELQWIRQSGAGTLVYSWWGPNSLEDRRLPTVLTEAARFGVRVAIHLEPGAYHTSAPAVVQAAANLATRLSGYPAFLPWFQLFQATQFTLGEWRSALASPHPGFLLLAQTTNGSWMDVFDGVYQYDGSINLSTAQWAALAAQARSLGKIFIPNVAPGYDESRAGGRTYLTASRENGSRYDRLWSAALASGVDYVGVTSFNEWNEGTQIAPAVARAIGGYAYHDYGSLGSTYYITRTLHWATALGTP